MAKAADVNRDDDRARFWSAATIADLLHGRWITPPDSDSEHQPAAGVSIDTRTITPGQAYVAIRGDRHDGHAFAPAAVEAGARLVIVDRPIEGVGAPVLQVPDTVAALQQLAAGWRSVLRAHGTKLVAVVGSNGKTSTRNLLHTVLTAAGLEAVQSPKSLNNHIGVPLTLLSAELECDVLIAEIGSNHPGETAPLTQLVRPDVAVVTSIGREHLEFFGDVFGVANELASIGPYLQPNATLVLPDTTDLPPDIAEHWQQVIQQHRTDIRTFVESRNALAKAQAGSAWTPTQLWLTGDAQLTEFALPGRHNIANARSVVAAARALDLADDQIARGLSQATPMPMRMQLIELPTADGPSMTLLNDAYNANPDSMLALIDAIDQHPDTDPHTGRLLLVLGDMRELGSESEAAHIELADRLLAMGRPADLIVLIGPMIKQYAAPKLAAALGNDRVWTAPELDGQTLKRIVECVSPGDRMAIKASRSIGLERIEQALRDRLPGTE